MYVSNISLKIIHPQTTTAAIRVSFSLFKVGTWDSYLDKELEIDRKRPVVWLSGTLNVPQLARLDLKYKKLKVLTALVRNDCRDDCNIN